jgi:glucokinase
MILAGDIGGTKTTLALFPATGGRPAFDRDAGLFGTYESRAFGTFDAILQDFCDRHRGVIGAGAIGVAGPVRANRCRTTNLPWSLDGAALAQQLGLGGLTLLNDLEAVGWGLDLLRPAEVAELQAGESGAAGNRAVIAAGTGLGEAGLFWDGVVHRPFATEGGHAAFAPRNGLEIALLESLRRKHAHVSWERVLSGPGLGNLARFLLEERIDPRLPGDSDVAWDPAREPPGLASELAVADAGAIVARHVADGTSAVCRRALDLLVELYGAEAGNLALKTMATGGLYVGGGIAPRILERLKGGAFLEAFRAKGRMRPLLEAMPVRVVLNPGTALLGAAQRASRDLS